MVHSPNGFNFDGLVAPDDLRRRFVAVRRSMNAEVRSLDAIVNFNSISLLSSQLHMVVANLVKEEVKRRGLRSPNYVVEHLQIIDFHANTRHFHS